MTADTSWTQRSRSWVAPPPAWVMVARDRDGHMLGTGPLLLLVYLWTLGDSTSRREAAVRAEIDACPDHPHGGWSHVTVAHADVLQRSLVARFERGVATIQGWERTLRAAGLMARPSEGVVLLADVEHVGYLPESTPGIRTGGVSTEAPDPRKAEGPTLENSRVDPQDPEGPTLENLRVPIGSPISPDQFPIKTLLSPEASASRPSSIEQGHGSWTDRALGRSLACKRGGSSS